jgi:Spy/CpxP family protein refolding chaperone
VKDLKTHKAITSIAVLLMVSSVFLAMPQANAQALGDTSQHAHFMQGLIETIAQKFGLDQNKVKAIVNDYQTQQKKRMQKNMEKRQEDKLSQLVRNGKITDAQKQAIIKEMAALKAKYNPETMKNLTPEQRKTQRDEMRNEILSWAKANSIDESYMMGHTLKGGLRGKIH